MMKKLIRIFAFFSIAIVLNAIPSIAQAQLACPYTTLMAPPSTIAFDPTVPVGTVLWSRGIQTQFRSTSSINGARWCPKGLTRFGITGSKPYLGNNLYETGIPGISYRFKMSDPVIGQQMCWTQYFPGVCVIESGGMVNHTLSVRQAQLPAAGYCQECLRTGTMTVIMPPTLGGAAS